jgi:DegV family protein with EDD domain
MKKFSILADATCDLGEAYQQQYDLHIIPGHIILPDKTDIPSPLKWDKVSREEFYSRLKKDPSSYSTAPANTSEFAAAMEAIVSDGTELLVMTISSGISGAFQFAVTAARQVQQKYPEAKIHCVDSLRFGPGFGLMVIQAARLRDEGKTMEQTAQWLEENKNRYHQAGWLDDLSFVAKKGRMTNAKAFFGTLAGIKPIGEFDYNGLTTIVGKVKGAKLAYSVLMDYIAQTIEKPEEQTIFIAQTSRMPQAEVYKQMIIDRFHPKEIFINDVFPSCGINIGPGLMAAYYIGKPISKDLSEEKAIIEKALNKAN